MKIQESTVQLAASHEASRSQTQEITTVQGFRQLFDSLAAPRSDEAAAARQRVVELLQSLVDAILAAIGGKKSEEKLAAGSSLPVADPASGSGQEMSWQRTVTQGLVESERTTVCGNGKVRTCDGREIDFEFSLALSRDYASQSSASESGTARLRDPLILSFDGSSAELTEKRLAFDLDADGKLEEMPGLGAASGFLVFDRNGNGRADDGSELFGVASGNGFADLGLLDGDHNGWIDENDPAYQQLAVWSGDRFATLKERGVGALYTSAVDAPFSLKTGGNELLGQIRAAGIYLSEAGEVGQLQQVDLAVSALPEREQHPAERQQLAT